MKKYHIDMATPDPIHEAALTRIRRMVSDNKAFVDAIIATPRDRLGRNFKITAARHHPEMAKLRNLWKTNVAFKKYLSGRLEFHYGAPYAEGLIRVFLSSLF